MLFQQNLGVLIKKTASVSLIFLFLFMLVFHLSGGSSNDYGFHSEISKHHSGYSVDFKTINYGFTGEEILPNEEILSQVYAIAGFFLSEIYSALSFKPNNTLNRFSSNPVLAEVQFYTLYCNWKFDFPG